jgi:hypothetical protein
MTGAEEGGFSVVEGVAMGSVTTRVAGQYHFRAAQSASQ